MTRCDLLNISSCSRPSYDSFSCSPCDLHSALSFPGFVKSGCLVCSVTTLWNSSCCVPGSRSMLFSPRFLLSLVCFPFLWAEGTVLCAVRGCVIYSITSTFIMLFFTSIEVFRWTMVKALIFRKTTRHFLTSFTCSILVFRMRLILSGELVNLFFRRGIVMQLEACYLFL